MKVGIVVISYYLLQNDLLFSLDHSSSNPTSYGDPTSYSWGDNAFFLLSAYELFYKLIAEKNTLKVHS
jgi:hypothetical protein